jgi:hypothetical protein
MWAAVVVFGLLGIMLLLIRALLRGSRLAIGLLVGAGLALFGFPLLRSLASTGHVPVWAPALPFAVIATSLFAFGLLAWFWSDD